MTSLRSQFDRRPGAGVWALVVLAVVVAYGPLVVEFSQWQWRRPHYQFFPFVLAAVGAMLWMRWSSQRGGATGEERTASRAEGMGPGAARGDARGWPAVRSGVLMLSSWLVLLAAVWIHSPMLSAVSLVLLAGAGVSEMVRRRPVQYAWGIWALLWLIVPLPLGLDRRLITSLQLASSWLSSQVLDAVGVLHLMSGNTLQLAGRQLFVDEACSGIISILSIVAAAAVVGVWWNRPPVHVLLLAASGVGWATLMNVLRISLIAWVQEVHGLDWSSGAAHETLSLALFAAAFGAVVATDQLLLAVLAPIGVAWQQSTGSEVVYGQWLVRGWDALGKGSIVAEGATAKAPRERTACVEQLPAARPAVWLPVASAFLALGVLQVTYLPSGMVVAATGAGGERPQSESGAVERALAMDAGALPGQLAGRRLSEHRWERRESQHLFGEHSSVYEYSEAAATGGPMLVSCDFTFAGEWHELVVCYKAVGWELVSRRVRAAGEWEYVEATFRQPTGGHAAVLFCEFAADGTPLEPPRDSLAESFWRALRRREKADRGDVFQVQVLLTSGTEPTEEQLSAAREALLVAREAMREKVVGDLGIIMMDDF